MKGSQLNLLRQVERASVNLNSDQDIRKLFHPTTIMQVTWQDIIPDKGLYRANACHEATREHESLSQCLINAESTSQKIGQH